MYLQNDTIKWENNQETAVPWRGLQETLGNGKMWLDKQERMIERIRE